MNVKDFWYDLPEELIAQSPLEDRASSRLLVVDKKSGEVKHEHFRDIKKYLKKVLSEWMRLTRSQVEQNILTIYVMREHMWQRFCIPQ